MFPRHTHFSHRRTSQKENRMIYALKTRDVSDHERRLIARALKETKRPPDNLKEKTIHVRDTNLYDDSYLCIYCMEKVHHSFANNTICFHHPEGTGGLCLGSDKGLPGIKNPKGITYPRPDST